MIAVTKQLKVLYSIHYIIHIIYPYSFFILQCQPQLFKLA